MRHTRVSRSRACNWSALFLSLVVIIPAGDVMGAIIVNGSFEEGPALTRPSIGFDSYTAPFTGIPGWSVTGQGIDYIFTLWNASHGQRSLDLNNIAASGVEQTFSAMPGARYRVTFDMAGNPGGDPAVKTLEVSAAGQSAPFSFNTVGRSFQNMGWESRSWEFVADAPTVTLGFRSLVDGGFGPALDNVDVVLLGEPPAVPLPPAILLGGVAGGAVLSRRRLRNG